MEYELAKQLKDAGFPQQVKEGDWFYIAGGKEPCLITQLAYNYETDVKIPTLEELIEACGDDISRLQRWAKTWGAYSDTTELDGIGSTPTEAVARLWLALHANGDASA
jgi:hypothetical protein